MKLVSAWAIQLRALVWLALAMIVAGTCVLQFKGHSPLQTNILALLPATERNPIAEHAVNQLAAATGNRAIFLVGNTSDEKAFAAAQYFAKQLARSNNFRHVIAEVPAIDPAQLTGLYLQHRYRLLSGADRGQLAQNTVNLADRLQQKLYTPFHFGLNLPLAEDPFGFTDNWLAGLPFKSLALESENGMLVHHEANETWIFISAELPDSAYDESTQTHIINTVNSAEKALNTHFPGTELLRTGAVFYAHDARATAEHEVDRIGVVSLIGMLLLLYSVFRSLRPLMLGLLSVGFGVTTAIVATVAMHGEIHLITLVFGASLIGEAIDYAIQYFAAHMGAGASWQPMQGLRRIAPGLTVALLTSLLGYSALALAPFPALSQIALFAVVGLSSAWISVFLLLPAFLRKPNQRNPATAVAMPQKILNQWQAHVSKRICLIFAVILLTLSIPGWLQLHGNDDIHLLIARSPLLSAQEAKIRDLIGLGNSSQFFLVEGASADEVLEHEEKLNLRLDALIKQQEISGYQSVAAFVPSSRRQSENQGLWQSHVFSDQQKLAQILADAGLRDGIATELINGFAQSSGTALTLSDWLEAPVSVPFRYLWLGKTNHGYASVILPLNIRDIEKLKTATANLPSVTLVDKVQSVSALFQQYRKWSALWLLCAICLVFGLLCIRYRWSQASVILMPTLLAMGLTLAVFGYLQIALTLFNMMALMLVLGVGVNYAIFLQEGGINKAATLAGVILSAGTTLLSFGMLAFSSMPALSSFGLTLLLGIAIASLCAPMILSFSSDAIK